MIFAEPRFANGGDRGARSRRHADAQEEIDRVVVVELLARRPDIDAVPRRICVHRKSSSWTCRAPLRACRKSTCRRPRDRPIPAAASRRCSPKAKTPASRASSRISRRAQGKAFAARHRRAWPTWSRTRCVACSRRWAWAGRLPAGAALGPDAPVGQDTLVLWPSPSWPKRRGCSRAAAHAVRRRAFSRSALKERPPG